MRFYWMKDREMLETVVLRFTRLIFVFEGTIKYYQGRFYCFAAVNELSLTFNEFH